MKNDFKQFFELTPEEWGNLWDESLFILDTNVLLNLHRYNLTTSDDLFRVLDLVSTQLWTPFQVALEYYENFEAVTIEQVNQYVKVNQVLEATGQSLKSALDELDLDKRHSRINTSHLIETIELAITDFQNELDDLKKEQPKHHQLLDQKISILLDGKIGSAPKSQSDLDNLYEDIKERYKINRPPGFMDSEKGKDNNAVYFHKDISYQRQYGDALLWLQTIDEAKKQKIRSVIFITDDYKKDWWRIVGGQKRGPRYELIDEIQSKAGVEYFHMYSSYRFLEFAKEKYKIDVDDASIEQIKKITRLDVSRSEVLRRSSEAEQAVVDWLYRTFSNSKLESLKGDLFDILIENSSGLTAYAIIFISRAISARAVFNDLVYEGYFGISEGKFDKATIIFVYDESNSQVHWSDIKEMAGDFFSRDENAALSENISIMVGYLEEYVDSEGNQLKRFSPK